MAGKNPTALRGGAVYAASPRASIVVVKKCGRSCRTSACCDERFRRRWIVASEEFIADHKSNALMSKYAGVA
jgi:hypothetical protein